ncbi:uncharacterized protein TRIADDRAFT_38489 [Trichoplax adhaerens]|uniref:TBC1 domain family member 15 n=1 Tax=Trichoplax adhaerens TaxID=10228 RepID=B3SC30_TRIAD|nr:hypothetical protein TRIADDRAFT_38489 [Trichoplax adhaerens]EDV19733.1 hypothetical protein TRIADDRAFT_38489 [Trichoplax adhaerens]|eukprot:XP_002117757.1 hypothetical protein TRIADDRAFT_38489 [Trichoplax adhaerens]
MHIRLSSLHSIKTSDSNMGWKYLIFVLQDGAVLPALHFHKGGSKEVLQFLERFVWLSISPSNPNCLQVIDNRNALHHSLTQLQIFNEAPSMSVCTRFLKDAYVETMVGFSRVTKLMWDAFGSANINEIANNEKKIEIDCTPGIAVSSYEPGFEFVTCNKLGDDPAVSRLEPLTDVEFTSFFDSRGCLVEIDKFLERAFRGGLGHGIRQEAWKYLLNYYSFDFNNEMKLDRKHQKTGEYHSIKQQWQLITPTQEKNFKEFRLRKSTVEKDVLRTDRTHEFYKGEDNPNVKKLYNILLTYSFYNFDLGYVQGMSDLVSPILFVMENEADTFWCFVGLMERIGSNFDIDQKEIQKQLSLLYGLIRFVDPEFCNYLDTHDSNNLYFCFRWLLVLFKREFTFQETMLLWEVLWSQRLSQHFLLFICLAIIMNQKQVIVSNNYGFNEIIKHVNELALKLNLEDILKKAETMFIQVKRCKTMPSNIKELTETPNSFGP